MDVKYGKKYVIVNSNNLEHYHLEAARIITGLPTFTKSEFVYHVIRWEKLSVTNVL
jgi:hypothetical protein